LSVIAVQSDPAEVMTWHVQYEEDAAHLVAWHPSPQAAIEAACRLIERGYDAYGIGTGPLADSIEREQIARIYALWAAARPRDGQSRG
jgi:hypothetical protein